MVWSWKKILNYNLVLCCLRLNGVVLEEDSGLWAHLPEYGEHPGAQGPQAIHSGRLD